MMEAIRSSETSVLTRAMLRHIPENGILHSPRRENLKYYILQQVARNKVEEELQLGVCEQKG
jgi:hypothetical protein